MKESMKPNLFTAIHNLVGGQLTGSNEDYDSFKYHDGQTPPSKKNAEAKLAELQAEYDANQYQRDRQYPSIGDQLDMQYHDQLNGTTTWKDAIAKVKADNPKGAE